MGITGAPDGNAVPERIGNALESGPLLYSHLYGILLAVGGEIQQEFMLAPVHA